MPIDEKTLKLVMDSGITGMSVYLGYRLFQTLMVWLLDKAAKSLETVHKLQAKNLDKADEQLEILKNINHRTRLCGKTED